MIILFYAIFTVIIDRQRKQKNFLKKPQKQRIFVIDLLPALIN